MNDHCYSYHVGCWNIGVPFDYRNVLLRTGATTDDLALRKEYSDLKPIYDQAVLNFEERKKSNVGVPLTHRDEPRCQVSEEQNAIIGSSRITKIKKICKEMFEKCDLILLQEVESDIALIKDLMPENFDLVYAKDIDKNKVCIDTVVLWNNKKFSKIVPLGTETTLEKSTVVYLLDITIKKIIGVASLHARGFNIAEPQQGLKDTDSAIFSDVGITDMLERFKRYPIMADMTIIGGDFNSEYTPKYLREGSRDYTLATRRFKLLEEQGLEHVENNIPTSFNKDLKGFAKYEDGLVTLDHLFIGSKDRSIRVSGMHNDQFSYPLENLTHNPSDHRPLIFTIFCKTV